MWQDQGLKLELLSVPHFACRQSQSQSLVFAAKGPQVESDEKDLGARPTLESFCQSHYMMLY